MVVVSCWWSDGYDGWEVTDDLGSSFGVEVKLQLVYENIKYRYFNSPLALYISSGAWPLIIYLIIEITCLILEIRVKFSLYSESPNYHNKL